MDELRVEVVVKESYNKTLARNRLKLAGHVERIGVEKLSKTRRPESRGEQEVSKIEFATGIA